MIGMRDESASHKRQRNCSEDFESAVLEGLKGMRISEELNSAKRARVSGGGLKKREKMTDLCEEDLKVLKRMRISDDLEEDLNPQKRARILNVADEDLDLESLIPGLADDVAVECLIRVPRVYDKVMKCVCRRWRDFVVEEKSVAYMEKLRNLRCISS